METDRLAPDEAGIARAADLLQAGQLVAFPTETVYGLGGIATSDEAVQAIFRAKGRPADRPVIVHVSSVEAACEWSADFPAPAETLAGAFWPGPLTLVVPRSPLASNTVTGGRETVGLRVPANPVAADLLKRVGCGVAAPSANRYGHVSPTRADHVLADLNGRIAAVLDGGPCDVGLESTIVEVLPHSVTLLRHGGISQVEIERTLGEAIGDATSASGNESRAPGMVLSHYAPNAPVRVVTVEEANAAGAEVAVIQTRIGSADDRVFAAALYAELRAADATGPTEIWVVPPADGELLPAILDRLNRAAHPRQ